MPDGAWRGIPDGAKGRDKAPLFAPLAFGSCALQALSLIVRRALWWWSLSIGVALRAHPARAARAHPVAVHAVPRPEPTTRPATLHPSRRRDAFPRPRLLVRRQHRDGITTVRLGLIA